MLNTGLMLSLKDGIGEIRGLSSVAFGEIIICNNNVGLVLNLAEDRIAAAFFTENSLRVNQLVFRTRLLSSINISVNMFGSVLDSLGSLDSSMNIRRGTNILLAALLGPRVAVEIKAPGIIARQSIYESLPTGIKIIDSLIPVGLGQRELIIGDRKTGKTALAIDLIINQLRVSKVFNFSI